MSTPVCCLTVLVTITSMIAFEKHQLVLILHSSTALLELEKYLVTKRALFKRYHSRELVMRREPDTDTRPRRSSTIS